MNFESDFTGTLHTGTFKGLACGKASLQVFFFRDPSDPCGGLSCCLLTDVHMISEVKQGAISKFNELNPDQSLRVYDQLIAVDDVVDKEGSWAATISGTCVDVEWCRCDLVERRTADGAFLDMLKHSKTGRFSRRNDWHVLNAASVEHLALDIGGDFG